MNKALFARYRWGLQNLINSLGTKHTRITAVRILQQHLVETLNDPAAREDILNRLNQLCLELTGRPFESFCDVDQTPPPKPKYAPPVDEDTQEAEEEIPQTFDAYVAWLQPLLDNARFKLPAVRKFVQARTITVLHNIESTQKGKIIQFLYDNALLFPGAHNLSLAQANLSNVAMVEADLGGIDLTGANLTGANLVGANLTQALLSRANLTGANLAWAILPGADLNQAELGGATLTGADFRAANLQNTHLVKANIKQADITQGNLTGANLLGTSLEGAILTQAELSQTKLLWTNLRAARLDGAKLSGAMYNRHTQWPAGFDVEKSGATSID